MINKRFADRHGAQCNDDDDTGDDWGGGGKNDREKQHSGWQYTRDEGIPVGEISRYTGCIIYTADSQL